MNIGPRFLEGLRNLFDFTIFTGSSQINAKDQKIQEVRQTCLKPNSIDTAKTSPPSVKKSQIFDMMDKAKDLERTAIIKSQQQVYKKIVAEHPSLGKAQLPLDSQGLFKENLKRTLAKLYIQAGKKAPNNNELEQLAKDIDTNTWSLRERKDPLEWRMLDNVLSQHCRNKEISIEPDLRQKWSKELTKQYNQKPSSLEKDNDRLNEQLRKIGAKLAQDVDTIEDKKGFHIDLLKDIRAALTNPAYQALKTDENHPSIAFLHQLCLASYKNTAAIDAYAHVGKTAIELFDQQDQPLGAKLRGIWDGIKSTGFAHTNQEMITSRKEDFFAAVGEVVHALLANLPIILNLPRLVQAFFPQEDQRTAYENIPGALFTEKLHAGNSTVQAHTVYTPTPTVGVKASPEFCAVLQSMENQQLGNRTVDGKLPAGSHVAWVYANLQDITNVIENPQSVALMELQREYPLSFFSITIAHDSPFMKGREDDRLQLDGNYKEKFLDSLTDPNNFITFKRRTLKGGAYYFPIPENQRKAWNEQVTKIVNDAYRIASDAAEKSRGSDPNLKESMILSAFRELAHVGIMSLYQRSVVNHLSEELGSDFEILASEICRSGIDRGGKENAEKLWGNPIQEEEISEDLVVGPAIARAMLSRRRLIIEENLNQIVSLTSVIPRDQVRQFLTDIVVGQTRTAGINLTFKPNP